MNTLAMWTPGWMEVLLVVIVLILLFGAKRLPDLANSLGRSIQEFKKGRKSANEDSTEETETPPEGEEEKTE